MSCGSAFAPSSDGAAEAEFSDDLGASLRGALPASGRDYRAECADELASQRPLALGLLIGGPIVGMLMFIAGAMQERQAA